MNKGRELQVVLEVSNQERARNQRGDPCWTSEERLVRNELFDSLTKRYNPDVTNDFNEDRNGRLRYEGSQFHFYVGQPSQAMEVIRRVKSIDDSVEVIKRVPRELRRFDEYRQPFRRF